jgi:hypothetical protein
VVLVDEPAEHINAFNRAYVSTPRRHGANPLTVLVNLFRGNTWAIPDPAPG